ncbi:hypothetical protein BLNAU_5343 [Blattamonas nauphoetae]|uniref:Uncharacterized protein n=1 Tax=Blattamonas nauphoetae TaxID=2049346 RepID=A0ABQ9Y752_9EUKA|nr:hypothetical protein BLNAU_5343 [Blattamonas nauphoetae]
MSRTSSTSSFPFSDLSVLAVDSVASISNLLLTTTPNADGSLLCTLFVQSGHLTLSKVKIIIEGTMDNHPFLSVPFGTLTLADVSVDGGSSRHTLSFVIVQQTGSLRSTKTTVKNIHSPYAAWVARLTGTELSIGSPESQSVFSNCVGDHVDPIPQASVGGGALFVSLTGAASKLAITNTRFEKCWSGLDGGAIFVSFSSSSLPSNYRISATFSECKVSTAEGRGKWVFVEGYNLPSLIREEEWEGTLTRVNRREHLEMLWGEDLSSESTFGSNSLLDILRPATDATSLFVDSKSEHGERNCGETEHTACPTIDAALLQVATANTEIVLSNSPLLSAHFVVSRQVFALIGFSSSSTSRPLSKLRVNATGFGGMGGVICGTDHSVLTLLNVEITTLANSDGSALFLFVVRDSEFTLTNCWVCEVSASVGFVECLLASSLTITHLTITSSSFSSTLFSLSDTSFLSISESEWRTMRVTKGGLVEQRGWPSQNIVFSKFELSTCLSSQPTQPLLTLSLSGAPSPTDRRQVSFSNCKFASSSSSPAPFVAVECVGVSVDVVAVKSEMLCSSEAAARLSSNRVDQKADTPFDILTANSSR